ncbi:hypothetical protein NDA18_005766 [Ustilago nuda]|nr:hypothetical protein NDA18_005766 [Ustilago nuda]
MGPKVMVTTADPFEENTNSGDGQSGGTEKGEPEDLDLSPYQQTMITDHEEEEEHDVSGLAPETQVGPLRYSVTIELRDSYCLVMVCRVDEDPLDH